MAQNIASTQLGYFEDGSVEVTRPTSNEGGVHRLAITRDRIITQPAEGVETVFDILQYAARTHGSGNALGWRDIIRIHEEWKTVTDVSGGKEVKETKSWKYFELSDYKYLSYIEFEEMVGVAARALLELGFGAKDVFNIYAQTSVNWQLMSHACSSISTVIATAYDTLGEAGLTHSLNEPESIGLFTNAELLHTVFKILPSTPSVKYVIYDGTPSASLLSSFQTTYPSTRLISIDSLLSLGKSLPINTPLLTSRRPSKDTLACIMYTSGSTGPPKGVCLTHGNLIASVGSVSVIFGHHFPAGHTYLAYLPLAHVLEYVVELCGLFVGITSGYARPKTLSDASVRGCVGDLRALKPNFMFGVPAVWEGVRKGIIGKVATGGWVRQKVFEGAIAVKRNPWSDWLFGGVVDRVVLSKVREATGGRIVFTMNGGAPISRETQEFLSLAVAPMMQGYGMTESCGMCTLLPPELMQIGVAGLPVPSIEIKLIDVPDTGYISNPPVGVPQRGEVCIRGPSVTKGYYKRPDLNNDETIFTKDGWFRTGDIGQWNEDGTLSIIDRIKNLVKLPDGEYIALEYLESVYKSCSLVSNICVLTTPFATQPMAVIFPLEVNLREAVNNLPPGSLPSEGFGSSASLADLCKLPVVRSLVHKECNAVGINEGFRQAEKLSAVVLTPDEWTPESGLLTAAMKVQRVVIRKVFKDEIEKSSA